ncbi:MAG: hypothetical protein ABS78_09490 [Phenylobacterium sp. SCN 70-31]|nr:MAG: hypothetical protein ABS78_09490 [Phenylobacterium sp. SCN 70-31]
MSGPGATCKTCPFWLVWRRGTRTAEQVVGTCKRYPPTVLVGAGQALPHMHEQDWCGEHPGRRDRLTQDNPPERSQPGPAMRPAPAKRGKGKAG